MKKILLLTSFLCVCYLAEGKIYKWTDENGSIHYSENKPENKGSSIIKIKTSKSTPATYSNQSKNGSKQKKETTKKLQQYAEQDQHKRNKEKERKSKCRLAKKSLQSLKNSFSLRNNKTGSYTFPSVRNETRIKSRQQELIRKKQLKINSACKKWRTK